MRSTILLIAASLIVTSAAAQVQTQIIGDSVRIHGNTGTAELNLENSTDTVPGFLFNKGLGRTQFKRGLVRIDDTTYLIGADTLRIHAGSGGVTLKWYQESATPAGSNNYIVTGPYAIATGGQSLQVTGINAAAIGGAGNFVGGNNSFGIGDNSVVVGGFQNLDSCVDCVILGGDDNVLHPGAVNSAILGTGHSSIYSFNSFIASASNSTIFGQSQNNGIGEAIIAGTADTVLGDGGAVLGGIGSTSYSYGETVTGLWATPYTPASITAVVGTDRLFNIGNGTSGSARSDALTILKNGSTTIGGSATIKGSATINSSLNLPSLGPGLAYISGGRLASSGITYDPSYGTMVYGIPGYSYRGNGVVPLDDRIALQLTNLGTSGPASSFNLAAPPPAITFNGSGWSSTNLAAQNVQFATWMQVVGGIPTPAGIYTISARLNKTDLSVLDPYTNLFTLNSGGYANLLKGMYIGDVATVPTAMLHLAPGNASAGGAPVKLTAGTILATPEGGAIEYDGSDLYVTTGVSTRYKLVRALTGQLTTDFGAPSVAAFSFVTTSLSVPGAQPGNAVAVNANSGAVNSPSIIITAYVGSANTVIIRAYNAGNAAVTMASDTYNVRILQ
jgi:hypothetical protein